MGIFTTKWSSVAVVAVAMASACGGGEESAQAFCDAMTGSDTDVAELATGEVADLDELVTRLKRVDPPGEIADEFEAVVAAYDGLSESGSLTDPASQVGLVAVQGDLAAVSDFVAEECISG